MVTIELHLLSMIVHILRHENEHSTLLMTDFPKGAGSVGKKDISKPSVQKMVGRSVRGQSVAGLAAITTTEEVNDDRRK